MDFIPYDVVDFQSSSYTKILFIMYSSVEKMFLRSFLNSKNKDFNSIENKLL